MPMLGKELLGIFLGEQHLEYACATRTLSGWSARKPVAGLDPWGRWPDTGVAGLRGFIERLGPSSRRCIYLGLPRSMVFARDIQLPPMPMEDALASVQSSLALYAHLPAETIYADVHLCSTDSGVNALVFYAARSEIGRMIDVFREAGHATSLHGVFPISYGIGAWFRYQHYPMPLAVVADREMIVCGSKGMLFSGSWPAEHSGAENSLLMGLSASRFPGIEQHVIRLRADSPRVPPPRNRLAPFPEIVENLGVAALVPAMAGYQSISLDGQATRIKTFKPVRVLVPCGVLLALVLGVLTWQMNSRIANLDHTIETLTAKNKDLRQKLVPMERRREAARRAQSVLNDVDGFIKSRPALFAALNDIAQRIPEGTWFPSMRYEKGQLVLRGQGKDALKILEAIRPSVYFDQAKLQGTVSRTRNDDEVFSLALQLKGYQPDTETRKTSSKPSKRSSVNAPVK